MTLSSSLNASVAGLSANASNLATISDNIANSETAGYKRATTEFHSMVIDSGGSLYSAGGVRVSSHRLIDERGPLLSTNNPTDLAVRGRGFLPVAAHPDLVTEGDALQMELVTTGSFRLDAEGYLTTTDGAVLMGWPADAEGNIPDLPRDSANGLEPIQISDSQFASSPTSEIQMGVNLPATATEAGADGDPNNVTIEYFDNLGKPQTLTVTFTPTVPANGASNEWTMTITDDGSAGAVMGEYTLTFDDTAGQGGTLASVTPSAAYPGSPAYDPDTGSFDIDVAGGTQTINVGIGEINDPGGMTQLSDVFAPSAVTKNGAPPGTLTSVEVDANGYVRAYFDTGINRVMYQVPLADVPNPNALEVGDNQRYSVSNESGAFYLWTAGSGPVGEILGFAQEEATVDVAGELTNLIQTQRAYSSNAKVIQTVDEMLQETTNMKR
ncbi:flagellar hook protein FlgE [Pseudoroseicyclus tamaricis]|uniref:Flagellar hook protein FlgE n=1 Tax=Pseudoroseicyclus tamaricis TaxID=2705421 RepID=A0A6B2JLS6_9RHOB|nr:flagellar hook protein FlgE [Pseudoroseicyclus tamaricis]NDV02521.1 flagellar hook protein FlgE [Pseudoroseicyclus tamaricis]